MLNRIILIGRLTRDIELRYSPSGVPVGKFTLAVDRSFTPKGKEKETDFIDIATFQKLAETCANYIGKGRLVAVEGRLQVRSYTDNQGTRRKAAEVIADNVRFLDYANNNSRGQGQTQAKAQAQTSRGSEFGGTEVGGYSFSEDEIPF